MTAPRWRHGMPADEYHADPAFSASFMRTLVARSPVHARSERLSPTPATPALRFGSGVHCRILEPTSFPGRFAVAPQVDRRTKAGRETWEAFTAEHPNAEILSETEGELIGAIAAAVAAHPLAAAVLTSGRPEVSGFWTDQETGIDCRCRFDFLRGDRIGVDLKTTLDASPGAFQRSITGYGYHLQAAHYAAGFQAIDGEPLGDFLFIAVEKAQPFAVGIYRLDEAALEVGERLRRRALRTIAECMAADRWPAYAESVEPISLPPWAFLDLDEAA